MPKIYFEKLNDTICSFTKSPEPAIRSSLPGWWKDMPKNRQDLDPSDPLSKFPNRKNSTIRKCPAVNDSVNFGYIIYFPFDIYINSKNNSLEWLVADVELPVIDKYTENTKDNIVGWNHPEIMQSMPVPEGFADISLKINSLWGIRTDPGYSCWFTHPINRHDLPFRFIDAIIDTDNFAARFPYSFYVKRDFDGVIKAGTPMIQVVPFKREDFDSEIVSLDENDLVEKNTLLNSLFSSAYKKMFWTRKKFL